MEFFKKWTDLERTNVIVEANSYDEMVAIASMPKLKSHRVILDFEAVTPEQDTLNIYYNSNPRFRKMYFIRLFDDYLTQHLRATPHTDEIVLIPGKVYKYYKTLSLSIRKGFCFSYVNKYGGYIYLNDHHCSWDLQIQVSGLPVNLYLFLLNSITGHEDSVDDSLIYRLLNDRNNFVTKRTVPRSLTFQQIILTSNLDFRQRTSFEQMINFLPVQRLGVLYGLPRNPYIVYTYYTQLLQNYPKIKSFRLFDAEWSTFSSLDRGVNCRGSVEDFPFLLHHRGPITQSLSLDISPKFKYHGPEYQHLIGAIPNLTVYTFYQFELGSILFFLMRGIQVNLVQTGKLSRENMNDLERLQSQYPHFQVVAAKTYLIPEL